MDITHLTENMRIGTWPNSIDVQRIDPSVPSEYVLVARAYYYRASSEDNFVQIRINRETCYVSIITFANDGLLDSLPKHLQAEEVIFDSRDTTMKG